MRSLLTFLAALAGLCLDAPAAGERPNILYVYVDDMGWGSIGPNGQAARQAAGLPHVLTPNIDALAAAGVNFRRAYGCTVCSPARSSQQSGFHQGHTYADRNNTDNARKAMRAEDVLMGDVLSASGYVTGYWGKWGYGASDAQNNPVILNLQTLPTSHGYQHVLAELHHVRAHTFYQPTLWKAPAAPGATGGLELVPNSLAAFAGNPAYPDYPAGQNDAAYPAVAYCDDSYSFAALDFVRSQSQNFKATGQPFFGLLAVQVPHSPYAEINQLPDWNGAYDGNAPFGTLTAQAQQWAAMITRIDAHLGNILAALDDPDNDGSNADSIANETLVIFQSDNGGPGNNARGEIDANGGLRGSKGSIWEGGIRVPLVMRWPAMITATSPLQAGTSTDLVVDVTDLLPTLCDLAGAETPLGIDGVSLAPTITGSGLQRPREFLIHEAQPDRSIIRGNHKLVNDNGTLKLYDLAADPAESSDLAGANAALVAELNALLVGERTGEAPWFANTYHHWTGTDGAATSAAANWSDYAYTNVLNSTTYQSDSGSPQLSWTATMKNDGGVPASAVADADLAFLGLEIGGASPTATQTLDLNSRTLTARNELRLAAHSLLLLDNGTVESLRWVDLRADSVLRGAGTVEADLYNEGTVTVTQSSGTTIPGPEITVPGPDVTLTDGQQFVTNGGFETGADTGGGDYSYATLADWFTDGPDAARDGAKPNNPRSGTMRGLVNGANPAYPLAQTTAFPFVAGDSYTLSFWHRGFSGWTTGELAEARVFYEDAGDNRVDLLHEIFPLTNGTWAQATFTIPALSDPAAEGKAVQVLLGPNTGTGFASFDDVSLTREGPVVTVPGPEVTTPGPDITVPGNRTLEIEGDYHEFGNAVLDLTLGGTGAPGDDYAQLLVAGTATLSGTLALTIAPGWTPAGGDSFTVVTAAALAGTFQNADDEVTGSDGTRFEISYSPTAVTVTVALVTAQGTPFGWLESFGIDGGDHEAADLLDHDGDGMAAWEEFVAGTDPTDPNSVLRLTTSPNPDPSMIDLSWPPVSGRLYTIEHSADLSAPFVPLSGPHSGTGSLTLPRPGGPHHFYRLSVERA